MIPVTIYPAPAESWLEINGEGGFPHSEICGSKVAHTSPQLIAACHVLHRLCMPMHPPIALTSRLRIHTTNDKIGTRMSLECRAPVQRPCLPRDATRRTSDRDPKHSTQLDNLVVPARISTTRPVARSPIENMPPRHRFLEPIHNVKEGQSLPHIRKAEPCETGFLHSWRMRPDRPAPQLI